MTQTLADTLKALPSTPTVVPDIPMLWRHTTSGTLLANGGLLTAAQALAEARAEFPNGHTFQAPGNTFITWITGYGTRMVYRPEHPMPAEPHKAASVLESDLLALGMSDELAAQLVHAVRTAIDGSDPAEQLRQWLAAWTRPTTSPVDEENAHADHD